MAQPPSVAKRELSDLAMLVRGDQFSSLPKESPCTGRRLAPNGAAVKCSIRKKIMEPVNHSYTDDFRCKLVLEDDFTRGGVEA
jgi:hypothetical protein